MLTVTAKPDSSPPSDDHKPSVVNGQLVRCSVSQVKTADVTNHGGCLRRWAWQKVAHIKEPQGKGAEESTKAHKLAENYLLRGELPAGMNAIERALLNGKYMLPKPGLWKVEVPFDGAVSLAGVPFNGRIDAVDPVLQLDASGATIMRVRDHKFLRGLDRIMTADQMERNVQMVGYGMVLAALSPAPLTHVDLGHWNYSKEAPHPAREVSRVVPLHTIAKRWYGYEAVVEQMKEAASKDPAEVPGNLKACYAYGKNYACPHIERCAKLKGGSTVNGFSAAELALFGKSAGQKAVDNLLSTPPEVLEAVAAANPQLVKKVVEALEPHTATTSIRDTHPTDGPGWRHVECTVCGMPMTALGKRPPGHSIDPSFCPNVKSHDAAQAAPAPKITAPAPATGDSSPVPVAVSILPPDAPKSDPELAAACPRCETEKNFQHRQADCPKLQVAAEAPKKRGRKPKTDEVAVAGGSTVVVEQPAVPILVSPDDDLLRDDFAKAALTGLASSSTYVAEASAIATRAYVLADAMLKARR